jgi:hypothetical protein
VRSGITGRLRNSNFGDGSLSTLHRDRVIGGTGLIGSKTAAILRQGGHEVVAASPNVEKRSLMPLGEARLGRIGLDDWLCRPQTKA